MFRQAISLKITLQILGQNVVDVLLNIDATAATSLSAGNGNARACLDQATDIKYIDNGYTALTTVFGQAGHAGIVVEVGSLMVLLMRCQ